MSMAPTARALATRARAPDTMERWARTPPPSRQGPGRGRGRRRGAGLAASRHGPSPTLGPHSGLSPCRRPWATRASSDRAWTVERRLLRARFGRRRGLGVVLAVGSVVRRTMMLEGASLRLRARPPRGRCAHRDGPAARVPAGRDHRRGGGWTGLAAGASGSLPAGMGSGADRLGLGGRGHAGSRLGLEPSPLHSHRVHDRRELARHRHHRALEADPPAQARGAQRRRAVSIRERARTGAAASWRVDRSTVSPRREMHPRGPISPDRVPTGISPVHAATERPDRAARPARPTGSA